MTSHRVRIGLLVPSSNTIMEQDIIRGVGPQATLHTARMHMTEATRAAENAMLDRYLPQAIADIASARPHITIFGCTSASALRGEEYDKELCSLISEQTGGVTISTIAAVNDAIAASAASRVAILTPYGEELNVKIRESIAATGVEVIAIEGMGITENFDCSVPAPEEITERGAELVDRSSADLLFISCTNFQALDAVASIERTAGVPVITSNSAVLRAVIEAINNAAAAALHESTTK